MSNSEVLDEAIAIIGMACRFPGASTLETLWQNLSQGVESISTFSDEELTAAGVDPELLANPRYVKARGALEGIEYFDAPLFGLTPNEAKLMDPQQRIFLECVWEALESAGCTPSKTEDRISTFVGASESSYRFQNLLNNQEFLRDMGDLQAELLNDRDLLPMQISYRFNLRGVSVAVQSACSTSLVALHLASQNLLNLECDVALAGGVAFSLPEVSGYLAEEGGVLSPDGHCRSFDARAGGAVGGSGAGVVVLKRLSDALEAGDPVRAVVRGTAAGNDGADRVGFTAPGVEGQIETISECLEVAGVDAESIGYVETHGSATPLGDPIEITSLTRAFRAHTERVGFCAVGAVKSNFGHLDEAAGIAGLIKTVLSLEHRMIPPSLHYEEPNPQIDFASSPFFVNTELKPWPRDATPRRAGVSSFGIGGTGVHVVLEEAPAAEPSPAAARPWQLLRLSARTETALQSLSTRLADYLESQPDELADVAWTLDMGRRDLKVRRTVLCRSAEEAVDRLRAEVSGSAVVEAGGSQGSTVFMFPGLGDHHLNMARELYEGEEVMRREIDRCADLLTPHLGLDLRRVLFAEVPEEGAAAERKSDGPDLRALLRRDGAGDRLGELQRTALAHPAVFVVEYALARQLMAWGLRPEAMIGYSLGELVAACLAEVLSLEDALRMVAARAGLIDDLPSGAMLAVPLAEGEMGSHLGEGLALAAVDGPHLSVVAGEEEAVAALEQKLKGEGVACLRLATSHAFHSPLLQPAVEPFRQLMAEVELKPPAVPFLSNVTGTWIRDEEATDASYWAQHLLRTVRFGDGLEELLKEPDRALVEVGPGNSLAVLARQQESFVSSQCVVSTLGNSQGGGESERLLAALGELWVAGVGWDGEAFHGPGRRRLALPTYPFERQRHWVEPAARRPAAAPVAQRAEGKPDLKDWFWLPMWKEAPRLQVDLAEELRGESSCWLLFNDTQGLGDTLAARLRDAGQTVVTVEVAETSDGGLEGLGGDAFHLQPRDRDAYGDLLAGLREAGKFPHRILHLWSLDKEPSPTLALADYENSQDLGVRSLLFLAQALGAAQDGSEEADRLRIGVVSNHLLQVVEGEAQAPKRAPLLGALKVLPQEIRGVECIGLDVVLRNLQRLAEQVLMEILQPDLPEEVALRGGQRWVPTVESLPLASRGGNAQKLGEGQPWLITGGFSGIGLALAEFLAERMQAPLALVAPPSFPLREDWDEEIASRGSTDAMTKTLRRLQALGAATELFMLSAEMTDETEMQGVLHRVHARFGSLYGVIHAASSAIEGLIHLRDPHSLPGLDGTQARGALVLSQELVKQPPKRLVLCSSTAAMVGGVGRVDPCASGAFLAALARWHRERGDMEVQLLEWGALLAEGGAEIGIGSLDELRRRDREQLGISAVEAGEAFLHALQSSLPHLAITTRHLPEEMAQAQEITAESLLAEMEKSQTVTAGQQRELATSYVAPRTPLEEELVEIWQRLFGIERIGIHDGFFDLGGHSLLSIQLVTRVRQTMGVELPVTVLFDHSNIEQLALKIEEERSAAGGEEDAAVDEESMAEIARLLEEVKSLSPEAVQQRLEAEKAEEDSK